MEMLISFSSRTLAPANSAKTNSKLFVDHDITVLDWPDICNESAEGEHSVNPSVYLFTKVIHNPNIIQIET